MFKEKCDKFHAYQPYVSYLTRKYPYVTLMYPYVTRMYSYVTRMYSYVTRMLLVVPVCSISHDR